MKLTRTYLLFILLLCFINSMAQGTNMVYDKIDVSPDPYKFLHADIDRIPGTDDYIISATQKFPFYLVDKDLNIKSTYDVGNWYAGSRLNTSKNGKYTLLQQLFYIDFSPNKDREVKFEVIETATGKKVLTLDAAHDADFHPNNQELIVLEGDNLYSYDLNGKGKKVLLPTPKATNCMAFSPDGSKVAISHHVEDDYLKSYVTKKRQKKNFKIYKKYRQCISVYETENYTRLYTVDEMFDIPYVLQFS